MAKVTQPGRGRARVNRAFPAPRAPAQSSAPRGLPMGASKDWEGWVLPSGPHPFALVSLPGSVCLFGVALSVAGPSLCIPCSPLRGRPLPAGMRPCLAQGCWGIQGPTRAWGTGLDQHAWPPAQPGLSQAPSFPAGVGPHRRQGPGGRLCPSPRQHFKDCPHPCHEPCPWEVVPPAAWHQPAEPCLGHGHPSSEPAGAESAGVSQTGS